MQVPKAKVPRTKAPKIKPQSMELCGVPVAGIMNPDINHEFVFPPA